MLSTRKGDQQARAEYLATLLSLNGNKPYLVRSGSGKRAYFFVLVPVTDTDIPKISSVTGTAPTVIVVGSEKYIPLDLVSKSKMGQIGKKLYDPSTGKWASSIVPKKYY